MLPVEYFAIEFIDQTWAENSSGGEWGDAMWIADQDVELSAKIALRNADIAEALVTQIPGLTLVKEWLEPDDYVDENLSQEAVLRRYHRCRVLSCAWRGGDLVIRIFDRALDVNFQMVNLSRAELPRFISDLQALLAKVEKASGMRSWHAAAHRVESVDAAVTGLLESRASSLARHFRATRRERLKRWLAIPSLAISGLLSFALALGIAADAIERGEILAGVQASVTDTFITDRMSSPQYRLGIFPKFSLQGHIEGQTRQQVLPVFRDEFLRAGPGAPYTVLPTGDTNQPYLLRSEYEASLPLIPLGGRALPWHVFLAVLPIGLWYFFFLKPLVNALPLQREGMMSVISRRFGVVLLGGMAVVAVVFLRRLF